VLTWSSGYVVGVIGVRAAGPFTLTFYRFALAALVLAVVAVVTSAPWPRNRRALLHMVVAGLLIQAIQFTGVYSGLKQGVPAGVSALIIGTTPLFTALGAGPFLGERVSRRQWVGAAMGVLGVVLAVANRLSFTGGYTIGVLFTVMGLFGITAGTLYQKKYCAGMDLRSGGAIQLAVAALVMAALTGGFERFGVGLTPGFLGSLLWLSVVNSIGAASLLYFMIARGEASRVSSFFYLVPSVTAVMAASTIGQRLSVLAVMGFVVAGVGVFLSTHRRQNAR
jgi:drug/metabolite transporter (DMT)-like permease